ncbi:MAG: hypothetical protein EXR43_03755 [Dehalococcoidia bacterium]|nr:hypothetical protein [Dehalococcoidia bacterium]
MTTQRTRQDASELREALVWLQEQMTQVRDQVARLQQDADDSLSRLGGLSELLSGVQERLLHQERQQVSMAEVRQESQLARETVAQLRERLVAMETHVGGLERQRTAERDHQQEEQRELAHRIDEIARVALAVESRLSVLDDGQQQTREALTSISGEVIELHDTATTLGGRTENLGDAVHRLEARGTLLEGRVQDRERADESLAERLQVIDGHVQRAVRQLDSTVAEGLQRVSDLAEQIDVLRAERARFESRLQEIEAHGSLVDERGEEHRSQLIRMAGHAQSIDERILQIEAAIQNVTEQVVIQIIRFGQTQERQKRRQVEDLEREIRELKQHARRLTEE